MDLYCEKCSGKYEYFSDLKNCYSIVRQEARADGWDLKRELCPNCSGKKPIPFNKNPYVGDDIKESIDIRELLWDPKVGLDPGRSTISEILAKIKSKED